MIVFLALLAFTIVLGEEPSSYLSNVLTKIQRERLGLLDENVEYDVDFGGNRIDGTNADYIYVDSTDDQSINNFKDSYQTGGMKEIHAVKPPTHSKNHLSSLPDGIYIYNDTIYLYKGHNTSVNQPIASINALQQTAVTPYKIKEHLSSFDLENYDATNGSDNGAEDLIEMMINGDGGKSEVTTQISAGEDGDLQEYYYYYYPLDQIPTEFANAVMKIAAKPGNLKAGTKPMMPGNMPMKPGMPIKMMMKKKPKQPVTPLFKAMAMFVGTAVMFILSILLMPRIKLVKAKSSNFDFREIPAYPMMFGES